MAEALRQELPVYLQQRAEAAMAPTWQFDANGVTGAVRAAVTSGVASSSSPPTFVELAADRDKLILLSVASTADKFHLATREFDVYLQRWGMPLEHDCQQYSALPEEAFSLVCRTFASLAQFEVDPADPQTVKLTTRGAALPPNSEATPSCKSGDVFQPVLRRTARNGQLEKNGVTPVAWTYIEATSNKGGALKFRVRSGTRRPFGMRKQARTEQLAIAIPPSDATTSLYLHVRKNDKKPLMGYEVLAENGPGDATTRIGVSDAAGHVKLPPSESRLEMLQVKHGVQLLAKLPVVRGAEQRVEIPLPDDDARLTAEMRLAAVREDLIDVVARRNILIARARQKIEKKDYKAADDLIRALDDLPGNPQFNLTLSNAALVLRSDDPQIQKRIDQLFKATQMLTSKFLDLRPVNQIHDELREAQLKGAEKPKS